MRKWIYAACAAAGISLVAYVGYKLYTRPKKNRNRFHVEQSNIDLEEILDDDILESADGETHSIDGGLINSDDELDSDTGHEETSGSPYGRNRRKRLITAKESAKLKSLAKKIRANKEKLVVNDLSSKKMLKTWLGQEDTNECASDKKSTHESASPHSTGKKLDKDTVFYNLFACYAETATHNK